MFDACVSISFSFAGKKVAIKTGINPEILSPIIINRFDLLLNLFFSMEQKPLHENINTSRN